MRDDLEFQFGSGGGPPVGTYTSILESVDATEHPEYGPGLRFGFKIIEGSCAGMIATRTTNRNPSPSNISGRIMAGLLGRQIKAGERVALGSCIGRRYMIMVAPGANGTSTRVESCVPIS
jgi:hypothetical protein